MNAHNVDITIRYEDPHNPGQRVDSVKGMCATIISIPNPDALPVISLKLGAHKQHSLMLAMYIHCMRGMYPEVWAEAQYILEHSKLPMPTAMGQNLNMDK